MRTKHFDYMVISLFSTIRFNWNQWSKKCINFCRVTSYGSWFMNIIFFLNLLDWMIFDVIFSQVFNLALKKLEVLSLFHWRFVTISSILTAVTYINCTLNFDDLHLFETSNKFLQQGKSTPSQSQIYSNQVNANQ